MSFKVGVVMLVVSAGLLLFSARKASVNFDNLNIPLMGVMGAFVFAAQMINFAIPMTGSSGHISGGILLAAILGAYPAFIALSCVLIIQALFFADGGILALGCNIFNMAFFTCFIGYPLIFLPIIKRFKTKWGVILASIAACVVSLQCGAFCVVLETLSSNVSDLPFKTFVSLMQPIHLAISLVEGSLTALVILLLKDTRPALFEGIGEFKFLPSKKATLAFLTIAAFAIGAGLSQIASQKPDGLEWAIEKTAENNQASTAQNSAHKIADSIQQKTAILPDYALKDSDAKIGTSVAGVTGGAITIIFLLAISQILKIFTRRNGH